MAGSGTGASAGAGVEGAFWPADLGVLALLPAALPFGVPGEAAAFLPGAFAVGVAGVVGDFQRENQLLMELLEADPVGVAGADWLDLGLVGLLDFPPALAAAGLLAFPGAFGLAGALPEIGPAGLGVEAFGVLGLAVALAVGVEGAAATSVTACAPVAAAVPVSASAAAFGVLALAPALGLGVAAPLAPALGVVPSPVPAFGEVGLALPLGVVAAPFAAAFGVAGGAFGVAAGGLASPPSAVGDLSIPNQPLPLGLGATDAAVGVEGADLDCPAAGLRLVPFSLDLATGVGDASTPSAFAALAGEVVPAALVATAFLGAGDPAGVLSPLVLAGLLGLLDPVSCLFRAALSFNTCTYTGRRRRDERQGCE